MKVTSEEWPLIERVLDEVEALAIDERPSAIARLCDGRPDLRETIEQLLDAEHACENDGFLDQPAAALAAPLFVSAEASSAPAVVGPFRILGEVGRGGYGTVYLGEREGIGQRVAVKVLRSGAGRGAQRRFRREQRLLASLDHPSIPRLIDSGIAPSGEAFLAMEYVEGEPITSYVNRKQSGLRDRLRLFLQACEAVRYAHAHLVVHRDIKPQNVLVGDGDRVPIVKVVDFGIAKPLDASEDRITRTGPSAPMTLAYAAPEQLRGESADPATDVYALGLLLYTLVADRLPYDLAGKSRRAAEEVVLDASIPRPSSLATATWSRRVRGDLDHVVLKALAKDRARRYPTADALHADVERFLEGLPVSARRPSRLYAAWRIAWRRRALVVGAAVAVAAAGVTYAAGLARQRAAALRAAEERAVVAEVLADVLGAMEGAPESSPTADAILERATQAIRTRLGPRPGMEAELLTLVATQYESLGRFEDAIPLYERAVALESILRPGHPGHMTTLAGLGNALSIRRPESTDRDYERADSLLRAALRHAARIYGANSPAAALILCQLGRNRYYQGRYEEASALCNRALLRLNVALADSIHWNAVDRRVMLAVGPWLSHPTWNDRRSSVNDLRLDVLTQLGFSELSLGHYQRAISYLSEASVGLKRLYPYKFMTATAFEALGSAYLYVDRYEEAESADLEALRIFRNISGEASIPVARILGQMVPPRLYTEGPHSALVLAEQAAGIAEETKDTLEVIAQLYVLGNVARRAGYITRALATQDRVIHLLSSYTSSHPDLELYHISSRAERSSALLQLGRQREAEIQARTALARAQRVTRANVVGLSAVALAEALNARGAYADAVRVLEPAYQRVWDPPRRASKRHLAIRMAACLESAYSAMGDTLRAGRLSRDRKRLTHPVERPAPPRL